MTRRIVLTAFGSFGDVFPYMGIAHELRARGYEPVLALPGFYEGLVEGEGFEFHAVRPDVDPGDRELIRRVMDPWHGTEFLVREVIIPHLRESLEDLRVAIRGADLLITHPITFAGPILAELEGLPWVSSVMAPMSFVSRHDLPVFTPFRWMKTLDRIPGGAAAVIRVGRWATRKWSDPVYALRRELGLPRGEDPLYEGQHSPRLVLGLFSRVLAEPQPDWPPQVRITGPIFYNGPEETLELEPELERFLDAGPPPVVFTLGSSAVGAAADFYRESVEAVRRLGIRAVMLTGPHAANVPGGELPESVRFEIFAPHATLFPRAAAIVHHGGAGTLHQGLRAGRPTLVVPFAHDQADNAYRVERLGVSRTLQRSRYRAARVERELAELLGNPGYARRARAVAEKVEDGSAKAAGEIVLSA